MADRLKIEGNFLVVFEDGVPSNEYIRESKGEVRFQISTTNVLTFYWNIPLQNGVAVDTYILGDDNSEYDATTIIDDRTGLAFTSVADLKTYLSSELGNGVFDIADPIDSNTHDGNGNPITSTVIGSARGLDVNVLDNGLSKEDKQDDQIAVLQNILNSLDGGTNDESTPDLLKKIIVILEFQTEQQITTNNLLKLILS